MLLVALSQNSRATVSELAQSVGLARQSVTDRIERLRTTGVIRQFTIALDPERIGLSVRAYMAVTMLPTCSEEQERAVIAALAANPYVQECYRVTGEDYFQMRVVAPGIEELKELVLFLRSTQVVQNTRTMLALETLFEKSAIHLQELSPNNDVKSRVLNHRDIESTDSAEKRITEQQRE
jgi:Lrp/AsnC family leucine-responsive transcriptional regulator